MEIAEKHSKPMCVYKGQLIFYRRGKIYRRIDKRRVPLCKLPLSAVKKVMLHVRVLERMLRLEPKTSILAFDDLLFFGYSGKIYQLNLKTNELTVETELKNGSSSPLSMSYIETEDGPAVFFGDYFQNSDRTASVAVYKKSAPESPFEVVYEFEKGAIRHVHGVFGTRDGIFVTTGDKDNESGIWYTNDHFRTVSQYLVGKQQYRATYLHFTDRQMIFATDTPQEQNYIFAVDPESRSIENLLPINSSSGFSLSNDRFIFITTMIEGDETVRGKKSYFSTKKGKGVLSDKATLYLLEKRSMQIHKIFEAKKDRLPYKLFQYGKLSVVDDPEDQKIYIGCTATKKYDGKIVSMKYSEFS